MKAIKYLGIPILFLFYLLIIVPFQSCDPDDECDSSLIAYKPNIYIYPASNIQLSIKLNFPMGGKILASIPEYGSGWNVSVDTNGLINNNYSYLFYESIQPNIWQSKFGWTIERANLESFFRQNMTNYGFYGQEIDDFVDYWIPQLNNYAYYSIYPQTADLIDNVIALNFSNQPDNILRLFYVIKGHSNFTNGLTEPTIDSFERKGFFVAEWGVILK